MQQGELTWEAQYDAANIVFQTIQLGNFTRFLLFTVTFRESDMISALRFQPTQGNKTYIKLNL